MASRRFPIVFYKWITNFGKSSFDYSNITENILISGEYTSNDIFTIQKLNVKCVIDMRSENIFDQSLFESIGIKYFNIPVDNYFAPELEQIDTAIKYIKSNISADNNILIHCKEGVGRSSLIIITYLITTGLDLFESMEIVKSNRWGANLNNIQFQKLKKWYELYKFS
jgi:protein-tyrosine phosphatase|tara:strand:- start:5726 stop:6229 length:504 start_codon:yes stop_codon:yes gene_type:complete